ncbi:hypothetical protein FJTKL_11104 [Diaporthe vaccinii]|uniref:Uncharacterized protein n=1 Tax=Diaporthe vaccinii TaxID=105482 RepID=A0ABR4EHW3_9PEZI
MPYCGIEVESSILFEKIPDFRFIAAWTPSIAVSHRVRATLATCSSSVPSPPSLNLSTAIGLIRLSSCSLRGFGPAESTCVQSGGQCSLASPDRPLAGSLEHSSSTTEYLYACPNPSLSCLAPGWFRAALMAAVR